MSEVTSAVGSRGGPTGEDAKSTWGADVAMQRSSTGSRLALSLGAAEL